jgi:ABC-type phosphate transport system auxiliary subunit
MPALLRSLARTAAPGLLFFLAACRPSPVATVNGAAITRAELDAQVHVFQGMHPAVADGPELRRQVLDQLIKQALLAQAARRAGLDRDPGLQARVDAERAAARERLQRALRDAREQLAGLDASVERQALVQAWSQSQRGGLTITAQDLRAAYEQRARSQPLPPFGAVRDQLMEQLILDRLVERERPKADVSVAEGALR